MRRPAQLLNPALKIADSIRARASKAPPSARDLLEQVPNVEAAQRVDGMRPLRDLPLAVITAMKPCPPEREWTCRDPRALALWQHLRIATAILYVALPGKLAAMGLL